MDAGHTADHTLRRELTQSVDRISNVDVPLKAGAIEIDRDMAHENVIVAPAPGHRAIFSGAERKRLVATPDQGRAADDRDTAPGQRGSGDERSRIEARTRKI